MVAGSSSSKTKSLIAMDLAESLADCGATILGPAATVTSALALIDGSERPDVAVLDLSLDGQCDFGVADALLRRKIPFIFSTGYRGADIPDRFLCAPCCEKPMETAALAAALANEIRLHALSVHNL
jgi:CheY-like chemotaxis protein